MLSKSSDFFFKLLIFNESKWSKWIYLNRISDSALDVR